YAEPTARAHPCCQGSQYVFGLRNVVKDTERVHEVEFSLCDGKDADIRLYAIHILEFGRISGRLVDCATEIHRHNVAGERSNVPCMTSHSAAGIQDAASAQPRKIEATEVVVEIRLTGRTPVVEVRPFVSKARLCATRSLVFECRNKSRDAVDHRNNRSTAFAT